MREDSKLQAPGKSIIPERFLKWLTSSRIRFLEDLKAKRPMKYFSAHLPVVATWNSHPVESPPKEDEIFPVNLTVKGIGLIPKKEILMDYIDLFEATLAEARTMPWLDSLPRRIEVMERLYSDVNNFDPSLLGGLEIFEGKSFKNMKENPLVSLLYMGVSVDHKDVETVNSQRPVAMEYISFQINGRVEILEKDNIYYRYLLSARRLFELERFHIYQPDYPYGYLVKVVEVRDKSPFPRRQRGL